MGFDSTVCDSHVSALWVSNCEGKHMIFCRRNKTVGSHAASIEQSVLIEVATFKCLDVVCVSEDRLRTV